MRKTPAQERIYVAGEKEHERQALVRQRGIPVNRNLRRDLQTVRDELGIAGYEPYFLLYILGISQARKSQWFLL